MDAEDRQCSRCKKVKPLDREHFRFLNKGYYSRVCKECSNKQSREVYHKRGSIQSIAFGL